MLLGALVLVVAAFVYGMKVGDDVTDARYAKQFAKLDQVEQRSQRAAAKAISKIRVTNQFNKQVLEREIQTIPDGTCVLSDDGLRALNSILENRASLARGELPGADAAR